MLQNSAATNTINNSQFYNNGQGLANNGGIWSSINSTVNYYNNVMSYNNNGHGILMETNSSVTKFSNIQLFNNTLSGILISGANSTSNMFYGNLAIFNNGNNTFPRTYLYTGATSTYSWLGRTGGTIISIGNTGCYNMTNPKNTNGIFLMNANCSNRGYS
jgi:hypothetical protein